MSSSNNSQKAIIFARLSNEDIQDGYSLSQTKVNLQEYAQRNNFKVLKEIEAIEDMDFGESPALLEILEFVEKLDEKVTLVTEKMDYYNAQSVAGEKLQEFFKQQKIEVKSRCHPCFKEPANTNIKIWRYVNFAKFTDLIQSKTLFFTRADFLRGQDKLEGSYHTKYSQQLNALLLKGEITLPDDFGIPPETFVRMQQASEHYNEETLIKQTFINCWHMADFENYAMWKIYSDNFGVAIETTYRSLSESFSDSKWSFYNEKHKIYAGKILYIDRNNYMIPRGNAYWPFMHKIREFSYEQELRCVINGGYDNMGVAGIRVYMNLDKLIHKIHISPFAPDWFKASVKDLCLKYDIDPIRVVQSNLS